MVLCDNCLNKDYCEFAYDEEHQENCSDFKTDGYFVRMTF